MRISDWSSDVCSSDLAFTPQVASVCPKSSGFSSRPIDDAWSASPPTPIVVLTTNRPSVWKARPTLPCNSALMNDSGSSALFSTLRTPRSEEHTSELQSLMRISYAVFCLKKKQKIRKQKKSNRTTNTKTTQKTTKNTPYEL